MATPALKRLLGGWPWFEGEGRFPIAAYSEFMPPPRLGRKPYGGRDGTLLTESDPWGWPVSEYEEAFELRPGLEKIAQQVLHCLIHLGSGQPAHGVSHAKLHDNPYWPPELASRAGRLKHERYLVLLPLALSRTQDDKGRIRWTLFGGSEQGPARAFWRSFFAAPGREVAAEQGLNFFRRVLQGVYGEAEEKLRDLRRAGFRILPQEKAEFRYWEDDSLPTWTAPLVWGKKETPGTVKYLLTFRPFGELPAAVQRAYLAGEMKLLPFPGSLVFWGCQGYVQLQRELPLAMQIPLLQMIARHEGPRGLRVPQSGWLHEPRPDQQNTDDGRHGPVRNTYKRTNRWAKVHRHEDELALTDKEERLAHVLFSALPEDIGLYGKPMARNSQLWTRDFYLLLDGPAADRAALERALHTVRAGGLFGYRFQYPAMQVGRHEIYWHRPLVAYADPRSKEAVVLPEAPLGYLTAYRTDQPDLAKPLELWPRLMEREPHQEAVRLCHVENGHVHPFQTTVNVRKILDSFRAWGRPLPRSFARRLLTLPKQMTLEEWLKGLPPNATDPKRGFWLTDELRAALEPEANGPNANKPEPLTLDRTGRRSFEVTYWKTIVALAEGKYLTKNNADCVHDPATQRVIPHRHRDLDSLGDYLLAYYRKVAAAAGMTNKILVGDLPFRWQTDFHYSWMGGWQSNQDGKANERDLIVVIPGRDRKRAVIMGDHYDTAYMADRYEPQQGGSGARVAACGADDNHSATAALMLGAPLFMELSKAGRLACDIWLIHLTGEEFPADCLGARHVSQWLVEGNMKARVENKFRDLSRARVQGIYVLDMIAHNNDHDQDVFQIAPGSGPASLWLAYQAHIAAELWNQLASGWNRRPSRRGRGRGRRSPHGGAVPEVAEHPLLHGEVRPPYDPRSTLYNTDGQVFSDAGIPVVLFMENYDINRTGYHDTHDTMANIDLDYGAAVAAITIEAVARAAAEEPPGR